MTTQKYKTLTLAELEREIESLENEYINKIISTINPINTTSMEYRYIEDCFYLYQQDLHDGLGLDDFEVERLARRMIDRMYVAKQSIAQEEMLNQRAKEIWRLRKQVQLLRQQ